MKSELSFFYCAVRNLRTFIEYRRLMRQQRMSRDALLEINWQRRQAIVRHAYETSPFYAGFYRSFGFHPNDLVSREHWCKIPLLCREHIAECREGMISNTARSRDLFPVTTGGTTGAILKSYHDRRYPVGAIGWRALAWCGFKPNVNMACIWRASAGNQSRISQFLDKLKVYAPQQILLDASSMTEASVRQFLERYKCMGPAILQGYVGGLHYLAEFLRATGTEVAAPLAVWSTAAPLSAVQRSLFERTFNSPVYDQYGSCEVYWIATECFRHEGLHINSDVRHLDFVDDNGADVPCGADGKIAVTDLENYAFPLIRYKNGDMGHAIEKPCSCGIGLPLMGPVLGRVSETMSFPNHVVISGEYLTTIFDDYPTAVRAFQVVQRRDSSLLVRVVANVPDDAIAPVLACVSAVLRDKTQGCVPIQIEIVAQIPHDRGKLRYIVKE